MRNIDDSLGSSLVVPAAGEQIYTRDALFQDRALVRAMLRDIFEDLDARNKGVYRSGLRVGMLFRPGDRTGQERSLCVGNRELVVEMLPGSTPPTLLKARIVAGATVPQAYVESLAGGFRRARCEGLFESQGYYAGFRRMFEVFLSQLPPA